MCDFSTLAAQLTYDMDALERLHELRFSATSQYFKELSRVDANYSRYIQSVLQQQLYIYVSKQN